MIDQNTSGFFPSLHCSLEDKSITLELILEISIDFDPN